MSKSNRRAGLVTAAVAGALSLGVTTAAASARTVTLHFFEKETSTAFFGADGKPAAPPTGAPAAGARFITTDEEFVGNHAHHAKRYSATDHIACTFSATPGVAICSAQLAVGGSMLFADDVSVDFSQNTVALNITGGTGIYKNAHGTSVSTNIGNTNNSDITFKVTI